MPHSDLFCFCPLPLQYDSFSYSFKCNNYSLHSCQQQYYLADLERSAYLKENPSNSTQHLRLLLWVIFDDSVISIDSKHVVLRGEKHTTKYLSSAFFSLYVAFFSKILVNRSKITATCERDKIPAYHCRLAGLVFFCFFFLNWIIFCS